jgi:hypothetical protein
MLMIIGGLIIWTRNIFSLVILIIWSISSQIVLTIMLMVARLIRVMMMVLVLILLLLLIKSY